MVHVGSAGPHPNVVHVIPRASAVRPGSRLSAAQQRPAALLSGRRRCGRKAEFSEPPR
jgi:hypothetical protein